MPTVHRVLPWRRHAMAHAGEIGPLVTAFRHRHPKANVANIQRAYEVAAQAHSDQRRSSGESYINHPIQVARVVADIGLDEVSIVAALLHDSVEDSELTVSDVEREFGAEVAFLVDGLTKLERIYFDSKEAQQAATMRKMLVAIARDLRVIIIKLADRLHNMRTLAGLPAEKQRRIAQETLDIYAPLAHRLGMQEIKTQLEDLAFAAIFPKRYAELDHLVATRSPGRELYLARAVAEIQAALVDLKIEADVKGRPKHLWSIYEKMVQKGREFEEIFDLLAIRVVVGSVKDCYAALGCVHGMWRPVVGRFKDYIAMPKFNLYQSLHATVVDTSGRLVEVQIRTTEMHHRAEWGVAAHWAYKEGAKLPDIDWLNRIAQLDQQVSDPNEFMEQLKADLEPDEIFVFTPKGKVVTLPTGSTPVDFAYAVHTEVGHHCMGAKVNGRLVPLDHKLRSGETCEILPSRSDRAGPSRDWLQFVVSNRARNKIRQWFSRERRDDMLDAGQEAMTKELRKLGFPISRAMKGPALEREAKAMNYADVDSMMVAIGEGRLSARSVAQRLRKDPVDADGDEVTLASTTAKPRQFRRNGNKTGIHVEGFDDVLVRLSRCCSPVPGDDVIGFVTRGRGVSVHRADCTNAVSLAAGQAARLVEVEWDRDTTGHAFRTSVEVVALDRSRLLRDVANALSEHHVNIVSCTTHTGSDRVAKMRFEFELADPSHLDAVLRHLKRVDGVFDAYRVVPGGAAKDATPVR
jgi:GTP pyrophosphokinase